MPSVLLLSVLMVLSFNLDVPSRILIAFVAELRVYGFWGVYGQIAEFRRILEEPGAAMRALIADIEATVAEPSNNKLA